MKKIKEYAVRLLAVVGGFCYRNGFGKSLHEITYTGGR